MVVNVYMPAENIYSATASVTESGWASGGLGSPRSYLKRCATDGQLEVNFQKVRNRGMNLLRHILFKYIFRICMIIRGLKTYIWGKFIDFCQITKVC